MLYQDAIKAVYLHALRFVDGETGGAELPAANVTRDRLGAPFRERRPDLPTRVLGRRILRSDRPRLDLLIRSVSVPVAAEVQRHRLLDRLGHRRHRGSRLHRRRRDVLDFGLTALRMTVKSLRLIRTSAGLARLRSAPRRRRRGGEYLQIARQTGPRVLLLHRGQRFGRTISNRTDRYICKYMRVL